jgi:hypothetical protein
MRTSHTKHRRLTRLLTGWLIAGILAVGAKAVSATSYISVEPVPNVDVIGQANLNSLRGIGYANLELWSQRLLNECGAVDDVIGALTANGAITTITATNTRFTVAAGGFEGATNPSFVFTVRDAGANSASQADVNVLSNALGYVQSQGGTVHFSPDNAKAYAFALDYAVVTFSGSLSGQQAGAFFEHLGTIDPALFSGTFAGFTQINVGSSLTNNSMLFLQPAVSKNRFISGLFAAASDDLRATYAPLKSNGAPTTARAGIAFPENDWVTFPTGDQYLANIPASPQLLSELAALRLRHLVAVANLLDAIARDRVDQYLNHQFSCPE